jgi:two-component system, OmpR family, copper resistance phosphate regulon response regulator CusR
MSQIPVSQITSPQILIVEDEPRIAAFLEKGLQKNGYHTTIARDGEEATQIIHQRYFDLVLLDLDLPIKDGWAVLRDLRQMPQPDRPIVIVLTARADDGDRHNSLQLGAKDYVTKPFRFNDLLERVNGILRARLPVGVILAVSSWVN